MALTQTVEGQKQGINQDVKERELKDMSISFRNKYCPQGVSNVNGVSDVKSVIDGYFCWVV